MTPETVSGSDSNSNDCNDDSNKKLTSFRIRNVNEINCALGSEESTSANDLKRKLPNWLQSPEDVNKKAKRKAIRRADPCTSTQTDGNNCAEGNDTAAIKNMNSEPEISVSKAQEPESESAQPDTSNELEETNCPDQEVSHQVDPAEEGGPEIKIKAQPSCSDNCDEISAADVGGDDPSHEEEADIKPEVNFPTKFAQPDISEAESSHPDNNDVASNDQQTDSNEADGREVKVKVEDISSTSTMVKQPTASPVVKQEASSSLRDSCQYGIRCYRRNPAHRSEFAHPGDQDYRRPNFPTPPLGTPDCPFGNLCYRRNPVHFQQYTHPESTDFKKNWRDHKMRLRKRQNKAKYNVDLSDDDDYDLDDPFIDDGSDDEYVPSDSDSSLV